MIDIRSGFGWVLDALGIGRGLQTLDPRAIVPVLDFGQDGWGHADTEVRPFAWSDTGLAAGTYDLFTGGTAPAPDTANRFQHVVLSLSIGLTGTGGRSTDAWLQYRPGPSGQAVVHSKGSIPYAQTLAASTQFVTAELGSAHWLPAGHLWVPPGYLPQLRTFLTLGASQTIRVSGAYAKVRAGFRAGAP